MSQVANIAVAINALLHVYILVSQMFLWHKQTERTPDEIKHTKVLAGNQGLYNGFLAAGLFWGLSLGAPGTGVKVFFLCCVLIAGLYGAATAVSQKMKIKIFFIQAIPAAIALALMFLS